MKKTPHNLRIILLALIFLAGGCRNAQTSKQMKEKTPLYYKINGHLFDLQAHRGGRGLWPENSLYGFMHATDMPVTTLEMDVVVSADHHVVVSHDPYIDPEFCLDTTGKELEDTVYLYQLTYEEISRYDCGSKPHPRFPNQKKTSVSKPLLKDVIGKTGSRAAEINRPPLLYNIEIKSTVEDEAAGLQPPTPEAFVKIVMDTLKPLLPYNRYSIQSFDTRILSALEKYDPGIRKVYLVEDTILLPGTFDNLDFHPVIVSPDYHLLTPELVKIYRDKGFLVIPWTVNEKRDMKMIIGWGVDGIISDYPDSLLEAVKEMGGIPVNDLTAGGN